MASISNLDKHYERKNGKKHDLGLKVKAATGKEFTFILRRNRVEVESAKGDPDSWQTVLTPQEKVQVFALLLDEYRKHSIGDEHGYRGAALGIADGRIFLGANTTMLASPYFKDCAEQNMVNAASDIVAYEQVKKDGWNSQQRPRLPKFDAVYVMGGVSQDKIPISCPCGKCTDMLAKAMAPEGKIFALPILTQQMQAELYQPKDAGYVSITPHEKAACLADMPQSNGSYQVWQTTIHHLNYDRELTLDAAGRALQQDGFATVCARAATELGLLENQAARTRQTIFKRANKEQVTIPSFLTNLSHLMRPVEELLGTIKDKALKSVVGYYFSTANQAAANSILQRTSVAELDRAMTTDAGAPSATIHLGKLNRFMYDHIAQAVADRMRADKQLDLGKAHPPSVLQDWVGENITSVRCVVLQLDDGTFRYAVQAASKYDSSMPNAEVAALQQALESMGRYGVRRVWEMEMNPQGIHDGVMFTAPKEGIERLVKRASAEGVEFNFIPFNNGKLSRSALDAIMQPYTERKIFPALFRGSRLAVNSELEKSLAEPPKAWTQFVGQDSGPVTSKARH